MLNLMVIDIFYFFWRLSIPPLHAFQTRITLGTPRRRPISPIRPIGPIRPMLPIRRRAFGNRTNGTYGTDGTYGIARRRQTGGRGEVQPRKQPKSAKFR